LAERALALTTSALFKVVMMFFQKI